MTCDLLTEHMLKSLIYCDKGCDRAIDSSLPAACPYFQTLEFTLPFSMHMAISPARYSCCRESLTMEQFPRQLSKGI